MTDLPTLADELITIGGNSLVGFVVAAVLLMATIVPKTAISIVCGTLYPPPLACGLIVLIATSAAMIDYAAGRWLVSRWAQSRVTSGSPIAAAASVLREAGFGLHLLVRLSPVPSMVISALCGSLECRQGPYAAAAAAAAVTQWVWVLAAAGTLAAIDPAGESTLHPAIRWTAAAVAITAALLASIVIGKLAHARLRQAGAPSNGIAAGSVQSRPIRPGRNVAGDDSAGGRSAPGRVRSRPSRASESHGPPF